MSLRLRTLASRENREQGGGVVVLAHCSTTDRPCAKTDGVLFNFR